MKRFRDAITGRILRRGDAASRPDTTVAETVTSDGRIIERLRWRCGELEATMLDVAEALHGVGHYRGFARRLEHQAQAVIDEEQA